LPEITEIQDRLRPPEPDARVADPPSPIVDQQELDRKATRNRDITFKISNALLLTVLALSASYITQGVPDFSMRSIIFFAAAIVFGNVAGGILSQLLNSVHPAKVLLTYIVIVSAFNLTWVVGKLIGTIQPEYGPVFWP